MAIGFGDEIRMESVTGKLEAHGDVRKGGSGYRSKEQSKRKVERLVLRNKVTVQFVNISEGVELFMNL